MNLAREVLDRQVVDREGHKVGKVDDLVVELRPGHPAVVRAIEGGRGALARHMGGRLRVLATWLRRHALGPAGERPPGRVGWEHVTQIDVVVHLDCDREEAGLLVTENAIWERWISHLPWAER